MHRSAQSAVACPGNQASAHQPLRRGSQSIASLIIRVHPPFEDTDKWQYIQATTAKAIDEGWDAAPYTGTRRQKAARAVEVNFQRLRAWCNDQWSYVGVIVTPICPHCGEAASSQSESLWGIESDCSDYIEEVAHELADQLAPTPEHADCEEV